MVLPFAYQGMGKYFFTLLLGFAIGSTSEIHYWNPNETALQL